MESAVAEALDETMSHVVRAPWSDAEHETLRSAVASAHGQGISGPTKVAAFIFEKNYLPNRSLYSIFWQCRKDRNRTV